MSIFRTNTNDLTISPLTRLRLAMHDRKQRRAMTNALHRLDDRLLTDIGVQRSSIAEFVTAHSDRQFLINQRVAHTHNVRQIGQLQPA